jgi:hypothetical protein
MFQHLKYDHPHSSMDIRPIIDARSGRTYQMKKDRKTISERRRVANPEKVLHNSVASELSYIKTHEGYYKGRKPAIYTCSGRRLSLRDLLQGQVKF